MQQNSFAMTPQSTSRQTMQEQTGDSPQLFSNWGPMPDIRNSTKSPSIPPPSLPPPSLPPRTPLPAPPALSPPQAWLYTPPHPTRSLFSSSVPPHSYSPYASTASTPFRFPSLPPSLPPVTHRLQPPPASPPSVNTSLQYPAFASPLPSRPPPPPRYPSPPPPDLSYSKPNVNSRPSPGLHPQTAPTWATKLIWTQMEYDTALLDHDF
eukprot:3050200-Rhodomonas_salina.1